MRAPGGSLQIWFRNRADFGWSLFVLSRESLVGLDFVSNQGCHGFAHFSWVLTLFGRSEEGRTARVNAPWLVNVRLVTLFPHRREGGVRAKKCRPLVSFTTVHAGVEVNPDTVRAEGLEGRNVPKEGARGVLHRSSDSCATAETKDFSTEACNLVSFGNFDLSLGVIRSCSSGSPSGNCSLRSGRTFGTP